MALIERQLRRIIHFKKGDSLVGTDYIRCDDCGTEFSQRICDTINKRKSKLSNGDDLCTSCSIKRNTINITKVGTEALSKIPAEQRKLNASKAGKISAERYDPLVNKSRFSSERWNNKTEEEKRLQVKTASEGLIKKLQDPDYAFAHFAKVFAQMKIGYKSKDHSNLHDCIENLGFKSHVQISTIQVDECNEDLKIVIEFNGDYWHCNPRYWKSDDYNPSIKMTAGEKWDKDRRRYFMLRKLGYVVMVIWESGWKENPDKYLNRIKGVCDEVNIKKSNSSTDML